MICDETPYHEIATHFFTWIFEEYLYPHIAQNKTTFEFVLSKDNMIAWFPFIKTFRWWCECDYNIPNDRIFCATDLMQSVAFKEKAMESLAFWRYKCTIGTKDDTGLRWGIFVKTVIV
jgi:hypothetical protein